MNSTSTRIWWNPGHTLVMSILFAQGLLIVINNSLLLLTILYHKHLRSKKEHIVIFSVAFADWLYGCALTFISCKRLYSFVSKTAKAEVAQQECLREGLSVIFVFGLTVQVLMLLMQSADRLLAISMPLFYFGLNVSYIWSLFTLVLIVSVSQTVLVFWLSVDPNDTTIYVHQVCVPQTSLKAAVFLVWNASHMIEACLSVALFGVVVLLYRRHMNTVCPDTERQLKDHMATQRRVTTSMAFSCAATLGLFVMPRLVNLMFLTFASHSKAILLLRLSSQILYNFNPILNFLIYYNRHENIRKGLKLMLKRVYKMKEEVRKHKPVVKLNDINIVKVGSEKEVKHHALKGLVVDHKQPIHAKNRLVQLKKRLAPVEFHQETAL